MDHRARPRGGRVLGLHRLHPTGASARHRFWSATRRHGRLQRAARTPNGRRAARRSVLGGGLGRRALAVGRLSVRLGRWLLGPAPCGLHLRPAPLGAARQRLRLRPGQLAPRRRTNRGSHEPDGRPATRPHGRSDQSRQRSENHHGPRSRPGHANPDDHRSRTARECPVHHACEHQPWDPISHHDRPHERRWPESDDDDHPAAKRRSRARWRSRRRARVCPRPLTSARRSRRGT